MSQPGSNQRQNRSMRGEISRIVAIIEASSSAGNSVATVTSGVWHKTVIQASWQSSSTGFFKLWFDGVKLVAQHNIPTTVSETDYFQFRVGLYANGWHDDGGIQGSQTTRQVWYDENAYGTTFADADPDQW